MDEVPKDLMAAHACASEMVDKQACLATRALLLEERLPKVVSLDVISAHVQEVQAISEFPASKRQALFREVLPLPVHDVTAPAPVENFPVVEHSIAARQADALIELLLANISHSSRLENYASCTTDSLRKGYVSLLRDKLLSYGPTSSRTCLNSLTRWKQRVSRQEADLAIFLPAAPALVGVFLKAVSKG